MAIYLERLVIMSNQRRSRSHIVSVSDAALSTNFSAWCMLWQSLGNKSWGHVMSRILHNQVTLRSKKFLIKFSILPKVTVESRV